VAREAEFAHEKHVERCAKCASDFVRDGDAAAREREDGDVSTTGVASEIRR
jgi:hypothetical protein